MTTFYEQLSKMPHLQAQITHTGAGGSKSWVGLIEDDISLSGSASYESPWEAVSDAASDKIQSAAAVGSMLGIDAAAQFSNTRLKSIKQTINVWRNSTRPVYPVTFTMMNYRKGMNVLASAADLYALLYPDEANDLMLDAPGGYQYNTGTDSSVGTFSLRYSNWFQAVELNLVDVSLTVSKTLVADGSGSKRPLYVTVSAQLTPIKMTTAKKIRSFFR